MHNLKTGWIFHHAQFWYPASFIAHLVAFASVSELHLKDVAKRILGTESYICNLKLIRFNQLYVQIPTEEVLCEECSLGRYNYDCCDK